LRPSMDVTFDTNGEEIVIYFQTAHYAPGIDAQAFGHALVAFDALYRSISSILNPGIVLEIEFVRSDQGSVKAVLKAIKKDVTGLVKAPVSLIVLPFLINILSSWLSDSSVRILVSDTSYVVERGSEQIVLPREAADKAKKVEESPQVRETVRNFFTAVEADPNVRSVDFRSGASPDLPVIPIERERFAILRELPNVVPSVLPKIRTQPFQLQQVVVLKAVLERSKSKWQFLWNGQRISADITDDSFFAKLANHEYEFGQGDLLTVDLLADQELNEIVGAYENRRFHVTRVYSHTKGPKQGRLELRSADENPD
jgi:hypothetical protein